MSLEEKQLVTTLISETSIIKWLSVILFCFQHSFSEYHMYQRHHLQLWYLLVREQFMAQASCLFYLFKLNEECSSLSSTHTLAWDVFLWHRIQVVPPQVKDNLFLRLGITQIQLFTDASALLCGGLWQEAFWGRLITSFQVSSLYSTLSQNSMCCAIVSHSFIDSSEAGCQHCASSVNARRTISWKGRRACSGAIQSSKQDECCKRGNRNRNDKNLQMFGEPED